MMKHLTKLMRKTLIKILKKQDLLINKSTVKALFRRGLINKVGQLTSYGKKIAISLLSLKEQCEFIGLKLDILYLQYDKFPEKALLDYYIKSGYQGVFAEAGMVLTVLKAIMLDRICEIEKDLSREFICSSFLESTLEWKKKHNKYLISSIGLISTPKFSSNFKEILDTYFIQRYYGKIDLDFAINFFEFFGRKNLIKIAKIISSNPYRFRSGWPDLTLMINDNIEFVEVKTSDKLSYAQIDTIMVMKKNLPFLFRVMKIKKGRFQSTVASLN